MGDGSSVTGTVLCKTALSVPIKVHELPSGFSGVKLMSVMNRQPHNALYVKQGVSNYWKRPVTLMLTPDHKEIYNPQSVLFFLYTSEEIANRPRNTHTCRNSKGKEKGIPPISQCAYRISFYNTVHAVIKRTSWNKRNHRSDKKRGRSLFTDPCQNFRIHIYHKTSQQ